MESSFIPPSVTATASTGKHPAAAGPANEWHKQRLRPPPRPLAVRAGDVSFRLLCHVSLIGGVIGKSGSIVKQLQRDTAARIRVDEPARGSDERVITVAAAAAPMKNIALAGAGCGGGGETYEVSAAQEALVRVFERIMEVAAEIDEDFARKEVAVVVSCRLLAETSQVGSVIGKGGKVVESIRKDTGSRIRVLGGEMLPACAGQSEELVDIEGDVLAVKKALIAVSRKLQDYDDKYKNHGSRSIEEMPQESLPNPRVDLPQHSSVTFTSGGNPLSLEGDRFFSLNTKMAHQKIVFRILCSNVKVGGVIGKGGSIVRALEGETGASINVGPSIANCDERLITIAASRHSPAQNALLLVFARSIEAGVERGLDFGLDKGSAVSARLLVPSNQVGCLLGKGGVIISEMRRATSTGIWILGSDHVPQCAGENDEVVQISGELVNVQDAICQVTNKLRDNLFTSIAQSGSGTRRSSSLPVEVSSNGRAHDAPTLHGRTSPAISHSHNQPSSLTQSFEHLGLSHNSECFSPKLGPSQTVSGVSGQNPRSATDVGMNFKSDLELGSVRKSAFVSNTTVEIIVPDDVISFVYGENGSNLNRLRQISGANVTVHKPRPGMSDSTVVISGTPDETQAAQSLLQAFILTPA